MKPARGQAGMSLPEIMVVAALAGVIGVAAYTVLTNEVGMEKNTAVQSLVDTQFSAGLLLARNPARLLPYLNTQAMGNCLVGDSGSGCAAFGNWQDFPAQTGPKEPEFQTMVNLLGPCRPSEPCLVVRAMRFRWNCTDTACKSLLVEVKITPSATSRVRERVTQLTLDRKLLSGRGQISFLCDAAGQSVVGVDYVKLTDVCNVVAQSDCAAPMEFFTPGGNPVDCKPDLDSSCAAGFSAIGLDAGSEACAN